MALPYAIDGYLGTVQGRGIALHSRVKGYRVGVAGDRLYQGTGYRDRVAG